MRTGVCTYIVFVVRLCRIVGLWRTELAKSNEKAAESIADPSEYENLFPELSQTLQAEKVRNVCQYPSSQLDGFEVMVALNSLLNV